VCATNLVHFSSFSSEEAGILKDKEDLLQTSKVVCQGILRCTCLDPDWQQQNRSELKNGEVLLINTFSVVHTSFHVALSLGDVVTYGQIMSVKDLV
jgi:hypothetical protein